MRAVITVLAVAGCGFQPTQSGSAPLEAGSVIDAPDAMIDALPDDLIAWYRMEEDMKPFVDATGHGHDGNCMMCPTQTDGVIGHGLKFGASRIDVPGMPSLETPEGTVMAWVAFDATNLTYQCPLGKIHNSPANGNSWQLCLFQSSMWQVFLHTTLGAPSFVAPATVAPGAWQHVAITWTASVAALYVDGNLLTSIAITPLVYDGSIMTFGGDRNNPNTLDVPLLGSLDEVKVFSRALSLDEIHAIAQR